MSSTADIRSACALSDVWTKDMVSERCARGRTCTVVSCVLLMAKVLAQAPGVGPVDAFGPMTEQGR